MFFCFLRNPSRVDGRSDIRTPKDIRSRCRIPLVSPSGNVWLPDFFAGVSPVLTDISVTFSTTGIGPAFKLHSWRRCFAHFAPFTPSAIRITSTVVVVVVSPIQRIGCQPEKTTLHGGQPRSSLSTEQRKNNKTKSMAAHPPIRVVCRLY